MTRTERGLLAVLAIVAVLGAVDVLPAVGSWWTSWHAVDQFGLSLTAVTPRTDHTAVDVRVAFVNNSGVQIQILEVDARININGHTVADALAEPSNFTLAGNQRRTFTLSGPVVDIDRPTLIEQLGARAVIWNISGQVQIQIAGQTDPTWVPYAGTVTGA